MAASIAIAAETAGWAGISHMAPSGVGIAWNDIRSVPKNCGRAEMSSALADQIRAIAPRAAEIPSQRSVLLRAIRTLPCRDDIARWSSHQRSNLAFVITRPCGFAQP